MSSHVDYAINIPSRDQEPSIQEINLSRFHVLPVISSALLCKRTQCEPNVMRTDGEMKGHACMPVQSSVQNHCSDIHLHTRMDSLLWEEVLIHHHHVSNLSPLQ
jgi:hypothetical protein